MTLDEVAAFLESLDGVLVQRPGPGDGTPEIAWGDLFCYYAPDGVMPAAQPFATVVTKDYPGDEGSHLDREGAFRVNVAAGSEEFSRRIGRAPRAPAATAEEDPAAEDAVIAHPVYGELGWLAVVNPGPRTTDDLRALLRQAYELARGRVERRASVAGRGAAPRIGTLDWQPAVDHPELLAAPVAAGLTGSIEAYVSAIDPDLADTAAFCAAYGVPLELSANCVVVSGRRAERTTLAACLVRATDRADVNKVIRQRLDVRKISFAPMAEAVSRTGMEYGGITPVGLPADWPILVDEAVAACEWAVVGSGIRGSKLLIRGRDLAGLPGAETLALAIAG